MTVCTDTPEQIRAGMHRHGARAVMLSDHDLRVTKQLGILNTNRALSPPGVRELPIPTTFLTDAEGTVRWIDQTDDYQLRSQPERVLAAVEAALP